MGRRSLRKPRSGSRVACERDLILSNGDGAEAVIAKGVRIVLGETDQLAKVSKTIQRTTNNLQAVGSSE